MYNVPEKVRKLLQDKAHIAAKHHIFTNRLMSHYNVTFFLI